MDRTDPISAFTKDGLRWVLATLKARTEVAGVMEEMLDTVEHWKMAVDADRLQFELQEAHKEIERMKTLNTELEEARNEQQQLAEQNRTEAKELREKLAQDLLVLSRDLKAKEVLQRRVADLQKGLERIPTLEKELQKTQKDLKEAQKRLGNLKAYAGRGGGGAGRQSPNPLDRLTNGYVTPRSTYISVAEKHTFFTTFMTLEEKLLLKVFSYLNAVDVLSTAEVCKPFYERVGAIFGKPNATAPSSTTSSSSSPTGGAVGGASSSGDGSAPPLPSSKASATAKAVLDESPITDKVATSIASKLTSSEMKGIIALTEKLKKLEAVVLQMQAENEDLRARLQGTESVKDFLISKLKDTEIALKRSLDGTSGAARQRASDQEVITFLDGKVQELEKALQDTSEKLSDLEDQHNRAKLANLEQVRVLNDMLQYERHKLEETEAQFKGQKKLLAKEIKSLRSEVIARQAERDGYREQLKELRQSVATQFGRGGGGR